MTSYKNKTGKYTDPFECKDCGRDLHKKAGRGRWPHRCDKCREAEKDRWRRQKKEN